ncbi:MAG: small acid-soluble spore protein SspI [Thermoactinomyces sp.]
MNFDIRGAVINNIHNMNEQELQELIVDSIQQGEEKLLPGLGVLFEVIWQNSSSSDREEMIETLHKSLSKQ